VSAPAVHRPFVIDLSNEVDALRLMAQRDGRVHFLIPSMSSLRSDAGLDLAPAEARAIATALIDAAGDAEGRKS